MQRNVVPCRSIRGIAKDRVKVRGTRAEQVEQGGVELAAALLGHDLNGDRVRQRRFVHPPRPQRVVDVGDVHDPRRQRNGRAGQAVVKAISQHTDELKTASENN